MNLFKSIDNLIFPKKRIKLKSTKSFDNMFDLVDSITLKDNRFRFDVLDEKTCNIYYESKNFLDWFFLGHNLKYANGCIDENSLNTNKPIIFVESSILFRLFYLFILVFMLLISLFIGLEVISLVVFVLGFIISSLMFRVGNHITTLLFRDNLQADIK